MPTTVGTPLQVTKSKVGEQHGQSQEPISESLIQALTSQRGTVRPKEGRGGLPPLHGPWQPVPKPSPPAPETEALHLQLEVPPLRDSENAGEEQVRSPLNQKACSGTENIRVCPQSCPQVSTS